MEFRIAQLAKYTIRIGNILNPLPPPAHLPTTLEEAPTGDTRVAKIQCLARNADANAAAQKAYDTRYKAGKIGGLSVEVAVSTLYILLGLESRRQRFQRFPQVQLSELKFPEIRDYLHQAFTVERNSVVSFPTSTGS